MEGNCKIEFGDIDLKLRQTYIYDKCVEFPASWPEGDSCQISFEFVDGVACNATVGKDKESTGSEDDFILPNGQPVVDNGAFSSDENSIKDHDDSAKKQQEHGDTEKQDVPLASEGVKSIETKETLSFEEALDLHENESVIKSWADEPLDNKTTDNVENDLVTSDCSRTCENSIPDNNNKQQKQSKDSKQTNGMPSGKPSWAGLFRNKANGNVSSLSNGGHSVSNSVPAKSMQAASTKTLTSSSHKVENYTKNNNQRRESFEVNFVDVKEDENAPKLAQKLHSIDLIYKPQAFIPRGLINISNWCFINATLQALLACPPLFQLLKILPAIPVSRKKNTSTPILDSFVRLASEFQPLSSKKGYLQSSKDVRQGHPFEPTYFYNMLTTIKSPLSQRGRQEDAEEFQSSMLNGMHEEMTQLLHLHENTLNGNSVDKNEHNEVASDLPYEVPVYEEVVNGSGDLAPEEEWEEVVTTKKNRSAVTRRADITRTPISEMFRGELCSSVFRPGQKISVSLEPFFSLPLDVPPDHASSVEDALLSLTGKEMFVGEESNDASRQQTLEVLPPILIMHLKRFVYDKNGGLKKIDKRMEYKTELVVNKELLSKSSRKLGLSQRSYKLFAVLYHHGDKATGGHYSTDVFHIGVSSWLRIDDQSIRTVTNSEVTRHSPTRTAYLLYYRRTDLG